jgi:hypothetical protein
MTFTILSDILEAWVVRYIPRIADTKKNTLLSGVHENQTLGDLSMRPSKDKVPEVTATREPDITSPISPSVYYSIRISIGSLLHNNGHDSITLKDYNQRK